jgi:hypothetical protein
MRVASCSDTEDLLAGASKKTTRRKYRVRPRGGRCERDRSVSAGARSGANAPIVACGQGWTSISVAPDESYAGKCDRAKISKTTKSYQSTDNVCLKMAGVYHGWGGSCEHHGWGGSRGHHRWDGSRAHPKTESICQAHYNHSTSFLCDPAGLVSLRASARA